MDEPERGTRKRASGFLSLPSTSVGRWSAGLLLLSVVLVLLNNLVVMPFTEQRTGLETPQSIFNLAVFLFVAGAGLSGVFALLAKRERSWAVILAVILLVFVVAVVAADMVIPG